MGRPAAPREGQEPRSASGARFLLAIAAVLVLGAMIGLAVYVRSAAKRDDERPEVDPAAGAPGSAAAGAPSPARAGARPVPARRAEPSESTPAAPELSGSAPAAPEPSGSAAGAPEGSASVPAEDRFLGGSSPPPASAAPAPAPPDPPRAPVRPAPAPVDDPRDFDVDPGAATPH